MTALSTLVELDNDSLSFRLYEDASAELCDRATGTTWRMGRVAIQEKGPIVGEEVYHRTHRTMGEEFPGRFRGRREGDAVRFTLLGRLGRERGSFACRVLLDGPWLELRIEEVDEELPSLIFPSAIESESLVFPVGVGRWVRSPLSERLFYTAFDNLSMRWFGGLRGEAGWLAVFSDGYADAGVHVTALAASPGWLKSMGRWGASRAVRYRCTSGGYVGLARTFRQWAKEKGLVRTLREKIDATPATQTLVGGRILSLHQAKSIRPEPHEESGRRVPAEVLTPGGRVEVFLSHAEAARVVREAVESGMTKGVVNVRGWIRGGYDESHPDVWPPEETLGTVEELRELLAAAPLAGVLHDNYQDIYEQSPSFPKGVVRTSDGEPFAGGLWAGGQAYLICSREALGYARRNWEKIRQLQPKGMFIDTTTAAQLFECRDGDHPISRAEDEHYKLELLSFYKSQDLIVGSEEGRDFGVPVADFYENRHRHVPGESIPLWPLVFHDAVVCARYLQPTAPEPSGHGAPNLLADLLWGYAALWHVRSLDDWRKRREAFKFSLLVDAWHARVGLDDMVNHQFVTEDLLVEKTEFSSGLTMLVNFSPEPRTVDGVTVAAGRHAVQE